MGVKRKKKREIKKKAVLSKMLERTAQNRVIFVTITKKEKSSKPAWLLDFCGGDGGIRTHVALITPKRFRVVLVMTTSIRLRICPPAVFPCLFPIEKGFGKN